MHTYIYIYIYMYIYMYKYVYIYIRPTQCIVYVHCLIARFQEMILLIIQYKYYKSVPEAKRLKNVILRKRLCGTDLLLDMVELLNST